MDCWEQAEREYPSFTVEERLKTFIGLKSKDGVPKPLRDYCQAAIESKRNKDKDLPIYSLHCEEGGTTACFLEGNYRSVSGKVLSTKIPNFQGTSLIIATLQVSRGTFR